MFTPAFDRFVAPARVKPQLWRLLAGVTLTAVVYALWVIVVLIGVWVTSGEDALRAWMERMATDGTPTSVLLVLATFLGMGLGPMLACVMLHKRTMGSLYGPAGRTTAHFIVGLAALTAVTGLSVLIFGLGFEPAPGVPMGVWLSFLPMALLGVLIQTGAEEVLFRGYLQTQLAALSNSPLVWMVLPSVIFGLLHYDPAGGANSWMIVGAATVFGLLAADLTRVTGSIGAAWGFHFANNALAIVVISVAGGPLSGLALYTTNFTPDDIATLQPLILRDIAVTVVIWATIRAILSIRKGQS